jgi:hypothetical protein
MAALRTAVDTPARAAALTAGLMLLAFVARVLLALHVAAPWEMPDELRYAVTSRSFLSSAQYLFYTHSIPLRTIYPALISPAWLAGSAHTAYGLIKVINAGLMTLGAIPLYLWARRLVTPLWAVVAVVLYLAIPGFIYSSEILTENAFVPASLLALFALAVALERPTLVRQLLALAAIALAAAARLQGVVFLAVLPSAIALVLALDAIAANPGTRRRTVLSKLRSFWPSLLGVVLAIAAYVVYQRAHGQSLAQGLGGYEQVSSGHYSIGSVLHWSAYHLGELAFTVGVVPVTALIVLFGRACRRSSAPSAQERAFLALTTAAVIWIVVETAAFASQFSLRIEERYMFALDVPLFLALVVWLARGLPRPPWLLAGGLAAPAAFVVAFPYRHFFNGALFNDTFGLIPLWSLTAKHGVSIGDIPLLVALGTVVIGMLFALVPRRYGRVLIPLVIGGFLGISSASVFAQVSFLANAARHAGGLEGNPSWIDRAVGRNARVEVIYTSDLAADPHAVWQAEFWNRSVRRLFGVTGQDPSVPDVSASVARSGLVSPALPAGSADLHPHFVVAPPTVKIAGSPIAAAGELVLWRVASPLRVTSIVGNLTPDGWTGAAASYKRYSAAPGTRHVLVNLNRTGLPRVLTAHVGVTVGPADSTSTWERLNVTVPGGGIRRLRLPVRRTPFEVMLSVSPTFSPSQFGVPDTRTLGVRASFGVGR